MTTALHDAIKREEFDYPALLSALSGYANPRGKITSLLRSETIIRVKKGLYVFGDKERKRPYSKELLSNLIYGPSLVSLDYALSFHGLIPEKVSAMTATTPKRGKRFETPVGVFEYRQVPKRYYPTGMSLVESGDVSFLMAVPERALADKVRDSRGYEMRTLSAVGDYLFEGLRIERSDFLGLNLELLEELAHRAKSEKISLCAKLLRNEKKNP